MAPEIDIHLQLTSSGVFACAGHIHWGHSSIAQLVARVNGQLVTIHLLILELSTSCSHLFYCGHEALIRPRMMASRRKTRGLTSGHQRVPVRWRVRASIVARKPCKASNSLLHSRCARSPQRYYRRWSFSALPARHGEKDVKSSSVEPRAR